MRERSSGGNVAADSHVSLNRFAWLERVTLDHELSPRAARLAAIIALRYAGKDATAWPSQSTLAADLGLDPDNGVRTVRALATELEKRGHLTRTPGAGRTSTLYALSEPSTERMPASGQGGRQHPGREDTTLRSERMKRRVESGCPHPPNLLKNLVNEPRASARVAVERQRALAPGDHSVERDRAREHQAALDTALWRVRSGLALEPGHGFRAAVIDEARRIVAAEPPLPEALKPFIAVSQSRWMWFANCAFREDGDELLITAPSGFVADRIAGWSGELERAAGRPVRIEGPREPRGPKVNGAASPVEVRAA